ncbi:hypothetical protein TKK_0001861 [Trichogramma kaykai]|uniref:Uncharacterized protein n=1 Tax=Trichogramma kaykai TaxID=54128 RepID=A0ABD2XGP3_9HYME
MKFKLVFLTMSCVFTAANAYPFGDGSFYFPDQIGAVASSNANSHAQVNNGPLPHYPQQQPQSPHQPATHGLIDNDRLSGGGFVNNNVGSNSHAPVAHYPSEPIHVPQNPVHAPSVSGYDQSSFNAQSQGPYNPVHQAPVAGFGQSQSNAQANSQTFGDGTSLTNAVSGSQSINANGVASSAAAAAVAGIVIIDGIPVATSSASASSAVATPHGGSSSSVSSSSNAGSGFKNGINQQYPSPHMPYNNYYNSAQQPWLFRVGEDDDDKKNSTEVENELKSDEMTTKSKIIEESTDRIVFKD